MKTPLAIGSKAPDFQIRIGNAKTDNSNGNFFKLSSLKEKNVVLAFYPADWSAVCGNQIALYNELLPVFKELNAEIVGISVDGTFCHNAFKEHHNLSIELLCDFEPKGEISKLYSAYNEEIGISERALYVIDSEGIIQYSYISPIEENPGAKEILETLKKLQ